VFKIIEGSYALAGTFNNFNTSLLTEGILHIFVIGIVIFIFPIIVGTSIFNLISSACVGFGSNS
jgi:hypothetical protein